MLMGKRKEWDWPYFQGLYDILGSWRKVTIATGIRPATFSKAIAEGKLTKKVQPRREVTKEEAQQIYNTGLSLKEVATYFGVKVGIIRRLKLQVRSLSEALKLSKHKYPPHVHTLEVRERISSIMQSKMANRRVASKRFNYNGVVLESTFELKVAQELDANNIKWLRPKPILYDDNGQVRRYYPDFYLPDLDIYLDPKNPFVFRLDEEKIKKVTNQTNIQLIILNGDQLSWNNIRELIKVLFPLAVSKTVVFK